MTIQTQLETRCSVISNFNTTYIRSLFEQNTQQQTFRNLISDENE